LRQLFFRFLDVVFQFNLHRFVRGDYSGFLQPRNFVFQ
jgi:hypothetical protein